MLLLSFLSIYTVDVHNNNYCPTLVNIPANDTITLNVFYYMTVSFCNWEDDVTVTVKAKVKNIEKEYGPYTNKDQVYGADLSNYKDSRYFDVVVENNNLNKSTIFVLGCNNAVNDGLHNPYHKFWPVGQRSWDEGSSSSPILFIGGSTKNIFFISYFVTFALLLILSIIFTVVECVNDWAIEIRGATPVANVLDGCSCKCC